MNLPDIEIKIRALEAEAKDEEEARRQYNASDRPDFDLREWVRQLVYTSPREQLIDVIYELMQENEDQSFGPVAQLDRAADF